MMRLHANTRLIPRCAALCLALILWTTAVLKLQAGTLYTDLSPLVLYGVVAIEIACALLLSIGKPRLGAYGAASIVLVGILIRILYPAFRCGCLGGTSDEHQGALRVLAIAVCLLAFVVVFSDPRSERSLRRLSAEKYS
ncbi:MAG: hypothetical protein KDC95_04985 [Planctomycetes bacterium]|nr:hypothetical protein [Planctomycetota bacterium]